MSVGVLIITHDGIGAALLGTACFMLDGCPLHTRLLTASRDCDPEELLADALQEIRLLDAGDGVLVLTDLYGATPSNIARRMFADNNVRAVSGLNLSMLIRVLNYADATLEEMLQNALSGATDGIKEINRE